jgi:hypothetical protein
MNLETADQNEQFSAEARAKALSDPEETRAFLEQLNSVLHARVNILLVAESLLLAALAQVWASKEFGIIFVVCLIAFLATKLLWDPLQALALRTGAVASLLEKDALYQHYIRASPAPLHQMHRLANWVPGLFLAGWVVILLLATARQLRLLGPLFNACGTGA